METPIVPNIRSGKNIFITGGTGYMGSRLIPRLLERGHRVSALVRPGSESKLPPGVQACTGDPFQSSTFQPYVSPGGVFIQLLGVRHPGPSKKDAFYAIDLPSVRASADAAQQAGVERFIYLSVAQEPTKIMQDYQQVRAAGEQYCLEKGFPCVFLRPWYVTGPGHRWPLLFWPLYALLRRIPATRRKANALGINTLEQMLRSLVYAVEMPLAGTAQLEVADIVRAGRQ